MKETAERRKYRAEWYKRQTPERMRELRAKWRAANGDKWREYKWRAKGYPEPTRPRPEFCELCAQPPTGRGRVLSLDHDHTTNAFRGWLCGQCNTALGMLKDSVELCLRAADYLTRSKTELTSQGKPN